MKNIQLRMLVLLITLFALSSLSGQSHISTAAVHAQSTDEAATPLRTITVVGEGFSTIQPDTATATIGVEVIKPTVKEASAENKVVFDTLFAALKAQSIADKDIQTSGFNIYMERTGDPNSPQSQTIYHVSNTVTVVIRDLETVGDVLDAAVEAGANNIFGVEFSVADMTSTLSQARKAAVENAHAKAEDLAKLNSVAVGEVVSISEVVGGAPSLLFAKSAADGIGGGPTIAPGQVEVNQQVQVTYMIAK